MKTRTSGIGIKRKKVRTVAPTPQPRYKLKKLLKGMTPEAMHEAFDWGPERGREIVDE
jgi:antitoxin MazE